MNATDTSWLWLENSPFTSAMRQWIWFYPSVEIVHIVSLAILFGAIALFDWRLLGFSRQILVTDLAQHLLPWTYGSFAIAILSGLLLFAVDATAIAANPAFHLKLGLIIVAALNAAIFQNGIYRSVRGWNQGKTAPIAARTAAILSLMCWIGVIICGRLIAYL
jgi:hypothetical protein